MTYDRGMLQASLLPSLPSQPASHARGVCSLCVAVEEQEETHLNAKTKYRNRRGSFDSLFVCFCQNDGVDARKERIY